ncbi:MAG: transcriptional regulator NrdR [Candidatus Moranbacteria bacterium]|jgi:transcriptional repressor NrdR|nr:transcriptional regulator NrdR [Candidatus Moranbacteria bacterium]
MRCPYCGYAETRVVDSRETNDGRTIRRRRECEKCRVRFSTYEQVEILNLVVEKKDGSKEEYKKEKLEEGLKRATNKRIENEEFSNLVLEIETEINSKGKCNITSREIGEIIMKKLKEKDEVSYLRFASVFKSFGSGKRFLKELNNLEKKEN